MQKIYSIKDKAMGHYQVFMDSNDYGAIRQMSDNVNRENTFYYAHAEDLELYCLGEINTDSGDIKPENRFVMKLDDMKKKEK